MPKADLVSKAYEKAPSISDDNIGNQMLRKMGWTGSGGIGKDGQGRAEPVMALGTDGKFSLGCIPPNGLKCRKTMFLKFFCHLLEVVIGT